AFNQNPIALWMHNADMPIGTWANIRLQGSELMAELVLAARGTSAFIDTLWSLMEQKILRAASVGFMPLDYEIDKNDV
ncbi:HK97 family phage prohead protease, partial [Streptococcus pneumoniae]|uniref:HK97 family phage prohead protease n=1 Tax=Streptococcus pneumoniae TaxID=1313 RepID=UPI001E412902